MLAGMARTARPGSDSGPGRRLFERRADGTVASQAGRSALPVVLLGLNVWLAGVLWPLLVTAEAELAAYGAAAACSLPLLAGALIHARELGGEADTRTWAGVAWLVAFPIMCGAVMTLWPHAAERALGTPGLVLLWLSLCVFGAAVARACGTRAQPPTVAELAPPDGARQTEPVAPRRLRSAIIALCVGGAAALGLIAPDLGALAADADGAARAGLVLTAVVGSALACTVVAVFLGSGLRTDQKPSEPRLDSNLRAAWFLFVALLGAVVYYVTQP
jgi:hypothetical protein